MDEQVLGCLNGTQVRSELRWLCALHKLGFFLLDAAVVLLNSLSYWTGSPTKYNGKKTIYNVKMRA